MTGENTIFLGAGGDGAARLALRYANRHGLIAGATGTGKTVTLQILAEGFSDAGVPVFLADVKGDLAGLSAAGEAKDFLLKRAAEIGLDPYAFGAAPCAFWDLYGEQGAQVRTTAAEMGPFLLSRLLDLNDTQSGVLVLAFRLAEDEGLPLLDLKDLRAILVHVAERREELSTKYGNVAAASVGAIQRRLLELEEEGAAEFFGEPALSLKDFLRTGKDGRGVVNILAADRLMRRPRLYGAFLLWLLTALFDELPEVGDAEKPKLVFFFDEAHLLFDDAPKALLDRIEQVVRLIRSKGVGVYFVTQDPGDVPDDVAGQLGARVLHGLRAYTPKQQKAVRAAAATFRANPAFDSETAIGELGVGEALISTLDEGGAPSLVQRVKVRPPASRMGPLTAEERAARLAAQPNVKVYAKTLDRKSAHEMLAARAEAAARRAEKEADKAKSVPAPRGRRGGKPSSSSRMSVGESMLKTFARTVTREVTNAFVRYVKNTSKKRR